MNFNQAINKSILKVLSKSKKNFLMGLEVTNTGNEYYEKFPKQVLETPVSELSSSGLAVGLALKGYKPQIVFGRVEFALLAFDQIFTQAGRMEFTFGGKIKCPVSFRIQIGRQWGNGPQHTANYHSIFMQSYGIDIFIPSTPKEAYFQNIFINKLNNPSVMLEHRYLTQIEEDFNLKDSYRAPYHSKLYKNNVKKKSSLLLITYADTLIDSLKAKKILENYDVPIDILNFSYFPYKNKIDRRSIKLIEQYKNLLFIDSAPFEFGILSGIMSVISSKSKSIHTYSYLSPINTPAPSAVPLIKDYYVDSHKIIKKIIKLLNLKKKIKLKKQNFDEKILWPKDKIETLI